MALLVYLKNDYENQHEMDQYFSLCDKLKEYYGSKEELCVFIGNYSIGGCALDGFIIKQTGFAVIEFKSHGGEIIAVENGKWTSNGLEIKGGAPGKNVLDQIKLNRSRVRTYLRSLNILPDENKMDLGGIVVFSEINKLDNRISASNINLWLKICDQNTFVQNVRATIGRNISFSTNEVLNIVSLLGLGENDIDKEYCAFPETVEEISEESILSEEKEPIVLLNRIEEDKTVESNTTDVKRLDSLSLSDIKSVFQAELKAAVKEAIKDLRLSQISDDEIEKVVSAQKEIDKVDSPKPILSLAVNILTDTESEYYSYMADRIQQSIDNEGIVIYNGNDEETEVPFVACMAQIYPSFVRDSAEWVDEFYGWTNSNRVIVIYFNKVSADKREALLRQYFDEKTVECWLRYRVLFDSEETMAIRVEDSDGSWYEHIINPDNSCLDQFVQNNEDEDTETEEIDDMVSESSHDTNDTSQSDIERLGIKDKMVMKALTFVKQGLTPSQIIKEKRWRPVNTYNRLTKLVELGLYDAKKFIADETYDLIIEAISVVGSEADEKEIQQSCSKRVNLWQVKMILAELESEQRVIPAKKYDNEWCFIKELNFKKNKTSRWFFEEKYDHKCRVVRSEKGYYLQVGQEFIKLGNYDHSIRYYDQGSIYVKRGYGNKLGYRLVHDIDGTEYLIGYIRETKQKIIFTTPSGEEKTITFN